MRNPAYVASAFNLSEKNTTLSSSFPYCFLSLSPSLSRRASFHRIYLSIASLLSSLVLLHLHNPYFFLLHYHYYEYCASSIIPSLSLSLSLSLPSVTFASRQREHSRLSMAPSKLPAREADTGLLSTFRVYEMYVWPRSNVTTRLWSKGGRKGNFYSGFSIDRIYRPNLSTEFFFQVILNLSSISFDITELAIN